MSALQRGLFIVFEGIDRTGKSTQARLLHEYLQSKNKSSMLMRFPDRTTPIGSILNEYLANDQKLDDRAVHLLFSANRWEAKDTILSHLMKGTSIICDRYAYSGVAFSSTKGLDLDWCKDPDRGLPHPDAVLYLSLDIEVAMKRGEFGTELYEKEEFQRAVKCTFEQKLFEESYWVNVPANRTQDELHSNLCNIIDGLMEKIVTTEEPGPLWPKHECKH